MNPPHYEYDNHIVNSMMTSNPRTGRPQCTHCYKEVSTRQSLRYHIRSVHLKEKAHECHVCKTTFASRRGYKDHMEAKHPDEAVQLNFGRGRQDVKKEEGELNDEKLAQLMQTSLDGRPLCGICQKTISTIQALAYHIRSVHFKIKPYNCPHPQCDKGFTASQALQGHVIREHPEIPVDSLPKGPKPRNSGPDEDMPQEELTEERLHALMQVTHPESGKPMCDICQKELASKQALKYHVSSVHFKLKSDTCHLCGIGVSTHKSLRSHLSSVHGVVEDQVQRKEYAICDICGMDFNSKRGLTFHKKKEHPELMNGPPGHCHACNYDFPSISVHMKEVHGDMSFGSPGGTESEPATPSESRRGRGRSDDVPMEEGVLDDEKLAELMQNCPETNKPMCGLCSKTFTNAQSLSYHVRSVHYKLKLFECPTCGKRFTSNKALVYHAVKAHPELSKDDLPKNIKCRSNAPVEEMMMPPQEELSMNRLQALMQIKNPENGRPVCDICQKELTSKQALKYHITSVHFKIKTANCEMCGLMVSSTKGLKSHMKSAHGVDQGAKDSIGICEECGRDFRGDRALTIHKLKAHNIMSGADHPGHCSHCDVDFVYINDHMKRFHSSSGNVADATQCITCHGNFNTPAELQLHIKKERCGWMIDENSPAKRAKRDSLTKLKCRVCPVVALGPLALEKHMKEHEPGYQFQCGYCGKSVRLYRLLQGHMMRRHPQGLEYEDTLPPSDDIDFSSSEDEQSEEMYKRKQEVKRMGGTKKLSKYKKKQQQKQRYQAHYPPQHHHHGMQPPSSDGDASGRQSPDDEWLDAQAGDPLVEVSMVEEDEEFEIKPCMDDDGGEASNNGEKQGAVAFDEDDDVQALSPGEVVREKRPRSPPREGEGAENNSQNMKIEAED